MNRHLTESTNLLEAVAMGDLASFEALYDRYASALYGLLLRILGRPEDAQEVLQEAFVQAWSRATMFDRTRGSEMAWLVSIARSRGIDRLRSRKVRTERETEAGKEISNRSLNVDKHEGADLAIASEAQRLVRTAMEQLPEAQRKALELAYFQGMSQSEIATFLGEPLGTIKTRMQLGMRKLRESLKTVFSR